MAPKQPFTRYDPPARSRTNTLSDEATGPPMLTAREEEEDSQTPTAAVAADRRKDSLAPSEASTAQSPDIDTFPENFDELPIELVSFTDRFITSLTTAKVYPTPPTVETLSDLFQEFYLQAESQISTHIQELRSRQYRRDSSPAASISSRASSIRKGSRDTLDKGVSGQQMLTSGEIYERRRARKLLEHKRFALEEAVERRACEEIYDRIWRHRSTVDEMRDEKLRSRTEGLSVVGVGLKELGVDLVLTPEADEWVQKARSSLCAMDTLHYPLGKLQSLAAAHHSVVELLSSCHQASSSADEILPTLIYVLIGSPVERMNLISNLNFVQRFRTASKMNGEAAYCLTNLEAAITFLETVDLTSLGREESEGAKKRAVSSTPAVGEIAASINAENTASNASDSHPLNNAHVSQSSDPQALKPPASLTIEVKASPPASPSQAKRPLSAIFQPQAAFGAAGDAVRSTADEGLRNIGSALDKSFNFMFGRLREHSVQNSTTSSPVSVVAPKTLDEARKLVSPRAMVEDDGLLSENSSITETEEPPPTAKDDRILEMITGSRGARDRSADSAGSGAKRPGALAPDSRGSTNTASLGVSPPVSAAGAVESMKNLGNSLNPLNRFAGMSVIRGFGRSSSPVVPTQATVAEGSKEGALATQAALQGALDPPLQQFLEITDPQQLRLSEVAVLLKDYQRLAAIVKSRGLL